MTNNLEVKVAAAARWSTFAEVLGKLIAPISTMVLARVLTPDAFGVIATINMIIAFAEIFADAGFQRYIIQNEFHDEQDLDKSTNVAFWTNLIISLMIWFVIALFADQLSTFVGSPGLGKVLLIACVSIPLTAFSSIQTAVLKRTLDFKSLFYRRLVSVFVPIFITIPLALYLKSYWALVIGTICVNLANAIVLMIKSPWRPSFYYNWKRLKDMWSFTMWSMLDSLLIWATNYIEIFIIGKYLSPYYLGLYKTSITTVGQFTSIITASFLPVLLPALSRLQNDHRAMCDMLMRIQKVVGLVLMPIGVGIYAFKELVTSVLLGSQWNEAVHFIGIWALMETITILFSRFCSNVFPAIGKPRISVIIQILHLAFLIPAVLISTQYGFSALFYTRSLVRLQLVFLNAIFAYSVIKLKFSQLFKNIFPSLIASVVMLLVANCLLMISSSIFASLLWIVVSGIVYFSIVICFKEEKSIILELLKKNIYPKLSKWKR